MGPIEFALVAIAAGWLYTRYQSSTMEAALARREKLAGAVREAVADPESTREFKLLAVGLFHTCLHRNAVPLGIFYGALSRSRPSEMLGCLTKSERKQYFEMIRKHFVPINALAAPHWYAIMMLFAVVLIVLVGLARLGSVGKAKLRTALESGLAHPAERHLRHNH